MPASISNNNKKMTTSAEIMSSNHPSLQMHDGSLSSSNTAPKKPTRKGSILGETAEKAMAAVVNPSKALASIRNKTTKSLSTIGKSLSSNMASLKKDKHKEKAKKRASAPDAEFRSTIKFSAKSFVTKSLGELSKHYEIGELLGEGAYGGVYLCTHLETGDERAVKIIQKSEDERQNDMVIREFEVLKELDHPNALKIYALYENESEFHIVTELIRGGELYDLLDSEFLESEVQSLMRSILGCMNYCHKNNVVHRDLKPENILLEANQDFSQIKVIDFGLAEFFSSDSGKFTEAAGSSYYMSPQVLEGNYSEKCDIWSCGIIAFVCLGGYAPYSGADEMETAQLIVDAHLDGGVIFDDPVWDQFSDEALDFINYLLTYEEDKRPTADEALQHPWMHRGKRLSLEEAQQQGTATRESLAHLKRFHVNECKLKQCTYSLIASQVLKKEEKEPLEQVFRSLDANADGMICENDLKTIYREQFNRELSDDDAAAMLYEVNFSASGAISYTEFVIASMLEKGLVSEHNLELAFQIMDEDKSGALNFQNLKAHLGVGDDMEDYVNTRIIGPADVDGDGSLSLEEFKSFFAEAKAASLRRSRPSQNNLRQSRHHFRQSTHSLRQSTHAGAGISRNSVRKSFRASTLLLKDDDEAFPGQKNFIDSFESSGQASFADASVDEKTFRGMLNIFENKIEHNTTSNGSANDVPSMFR